MNHFLPWLAEVSGFVDSVSGESNVFTSGLSEMSIIFGAVLVVILMSLVGVFVFRKQLLRRKKHRHHHHRRKPDEAVSGRNGHDSVPRGEMIKRGKRRRVRRKHRSRNPSLAETRGLPPNREEQAAVPPPS
ncbi:MAG TPA: hypothetical protein VFC07_06110 [Verrucomicrobiae bacterium]|nr:hypothetical protein [Verrucomicrobiae bacterium]